MAPQLETRPTTVREIAPGESLKAFIDLQWRINAEDPQWISPLRMTIAGALDRTKHPFHQHAEVAYFLAERDGQPCGRIAAIVNRLHNSHHQDRVGFFGLFECENDAGTAEALFDAAQAWLAARGMDSMRGPLNFSTNEEIASPGVLVDGFDRPPAVMMTHNLPYYGSLFEGAGFGKAQDLLAFWLEHKGAPPERGARVLNRLLDRVGVRIRTFDLKRFKAEVDAIKEVYNAAWSKNWGFVPMTDAEFDHLAKEFRPVVDPDLCLIAEAGDEPVGFSLSLPNLNEAFRHLPNGRLLPFGWLRFLWHKRKISSIRVITLGFKPHLHRAGLGTAFYQGTWMNGVAKGYLSGEGSWVLEENREMVHALERIGATAYKRYRIYERPIR